MARISSFISYDDSEEPWVQYTERLQLYFVANDIEDETKKRAVFLTMLGPKTYSCLRGLLSPAKPVEKTLQEIIAVLTNHFNPRPSEIVERVNFNQRNRKVGESVSMYISELRKLAEHCIFGATLETMLRDRLVAGIMDEVIQARLLSEPEPLSFKRAIDIALSLEAAAKNLQVLNTPPNATGTSLHKLSSPRCRDYLNKQTQHSKHQNNFDDKKTARKTTTTPTTKGNSSCYRCGDTRHKANKCFHSNTTCSYCKKLGHLAKVCLSAQRDNSNTSYIRNSRPRNGRQFVHTVHLEESTKTPTIDAQPTISSHIGNPEYDLFHMRTIEPSPAPYIECFTIDGQPHLMEIDSGAAYTIVSHSTFRSLLPKICTNELSKTSITLSTYNGHKVKVLGSKDVTVTFSGVTKLLPLLIVSQEGASLCGRNWIAEFNILSRTDSLHQTTDNKKLEQTLSSYPELFSPGLGKIKGVQVHLHMKPDIVPRFFKARPIPFALKERVGDELQRLENEGIIEPVHTSDWAAPIVPVVKADGSIRICGDFKLTANKATDTEQYPLPKIEELFANLNGGQKFTKLDLKDAYNQLELDEASRQLVVINTHKGLYRFTRLPFGVSSASAAFQRQIEHILQGTKGTSTFQDDLLITGKNDEEHINNLDTALSKLNTAGVKLRINKCEFFASSVEYLGHVLDAQGLHPSPKNLEPILQAPAPNDVNQLRSFLGLITYYAKFLPNMSTLLAPLYKLTRAGEKWIWDSHAEIAFSEAKKHLTSDNVLIHYNANKPLLLMCDASPVGIGAVLSHPEPDGTDRPIAFASRTLNKAEMNYSQIEKESLAIIFGVTRFRQYLLGRNFTLYTDHSPLAVLLAPNKQIPCTTAARIQRWAITLAAYSYDIRFRPGNQNSNADAISRLPLPHFCKNTPMISEHVLLLVNQDSTPLTSDHIKKSTQDDPVLSKIAKCIIDGWPTQMDEDLKPYYSRRNELTMEAYSGILLWNNRILIPAQHRQRILSDIHEGHTGMTKMKRKARTTVWWPNIDRDIEIAVASCKICQQQSPMPPQTTFHWPKTTRPMERVHIDYAGPIDDVMILVFVDSFSNWIEATPTKTANSTSTIEHLREIFGRYGLPECLVSDNGTPFTSQEFKTFIQNNGIRHLTIPAYHPPSNGHAERAVKTVKTNLNKNKEGTLRTRLSRILFTHHTLPNEEGKSPAYLFLNRELRNRLDLLHPRESPSKKDSTPLNLPFPIGTKLWSRNYAKGPKWLEGIVTAVLGTTMLEVATPAGTTRRHVTQIRHNKGIPAVTPDLESSKSDNTVRFQNSPQIEKPTFQSPLTRPVEPPRTSSRFRQPPKRLNL